MHLNSGMIYDFATKVTTQQNRAPGTFQHKGNKATKKKKEKYSADEILSD